MRGIGVPEFVIMLSLLAFWVVPIVAAVWLLRTVARAARVQDEILNRVRAIEGKLDGRLAG